MVAHSYKSADNFSRIFNRVAIILYLIFAGFLFILNEFSSDDAAFFSIDWSLFYFSLIYLSSILLIRKYYLSKSIAYLESVDRVEQCAHEALHNDSPNNINVCSLKNSRMSIAKLAIKQQAIIEEFTQEHTKIDQLIRERALLDRETGIGNREFFTNRLAALLKEESSRGVVFFIQFKECEIVQSLYGHQQALGLLDNLIQNVNTTLKKQSNVFIARRSEFELALIISGVYYNEAEKIAGKLQQNLTRVTLPVGINEECFFHIGGSYFSAHQDSYQVMAEADMALRNAELQGPSQWFMYDPGEVSRETAKGSLRWRTFLLKVMKKGALTLYFQPLIAEDSDSIIHHEVLSRIKDFDGSIINARIFLPMAIKCGLIQQIDMYIVDKVISEITKTPNNFGIYSINISLESLLSEDFMREFESKLSQHKNACEQLTIEVSEYQLVNHLSQLLPILNSLSALGVTVLADKVGQYIVNASYLKTCPISSLKLHRSIVLDIQNKPENQVFVQSLITLCEPENIDVYALGVEATAEWQTLLKLGITGGQGHVFNKFDHQVASIM